MFLFDSSKLWMLNWSKMEKALRNIFGHVAERRIRLFKRVTRILGIAFSIACIALLRMLWWLNVAPFGLPVVPEVNLIRALLHEPLSIKLHLVYELCLDINEVFAFQWRYNILDLIDMRRVLTELKIGTSWVNKTKFLKYQRCPDRCENCRTKTCERQQVRQNSWKGYSCYQLSNSLGR